MSYENFMDLRKISTPKRAPTKKQNKLCFLKIFSKEGVASLFLGCLLHSVTLRFLNYWDIGVFQLHWHESYLLVFPSCYLLFYTSGGPLSPLSLGLSHFYLTYSPAWQDFY